MALVQIPTPENWLPDLTLLNTGGTSLSGSGTITINVSSFNSYFFIVQTGSSASGSSVLSIRINGDTGSNYGLTAIGWNNTNRTDEFSNSTTSIKLATLGSAASSTWRVMGEILGGKTSGIKSINHTAYGTTDGDFLSGNAIYKGTSPVTSISFISGTGNFDAGTVFVYGG